MGSMETQVKAVVARHFGISPSKVRLDDSFIGGLGGDALDMVELGWEIEAAFDVALTTGVRDSLVSCRAVVEWLKEYGTPRRGCRQDGEGGEQQAYDSKGGGRRQQAYYNKVGGASAGRALEVFMVGSWLNRKREPDPPTRREGKEKIPRVGATTQTGCLLVVGEKSPRPRAKRQSG